MSINNINSKNFAELFDNKLSVATFIRSGGGYDYYKITIYEDGSLQYNLIRDTPYQPLYDGFKLTIPKYNTNKQKILTDDILNRLLTYLRNNLIQRPGSKWQGDLFNSYVLKGTQIYITFNDNITKIAIYDTKKYVPILTLNVDIRKPIYKFYSLEKLLSKTLNGTQRDFKNVINSKFPNYLK